MSAIASAVTIITIDLLSACAANLNKCRFSCFLHFVFSGISVNKASLSISLFAVLLSSQIHRTIFVTKPAGVVSPKLSRIPLTHVEKKKLKGSKSNRNL
ncbi:hypothetical protein AVEN_126795-1 [Araneus ventricosus]|uniref:Uncharacterized protein n=1 Tax=Araneus ventricosus TaxID=182803 RepID=A0A4Y2UAE3_ARAVE|nr:hypothetical protein AVEN_126795-1 [Araneus ventricosus]